MFIGVLLAERKFLINLVRSLVKKMLTTTSLFNGSDQQKMAAFPSFQNDPFLTREFSKF